jgi:hypothetical protein
LNEYTKLSHLAVGIFFAINAAKPDPKWRLLRDTS